MKDARGDQGPVWWRCILSVQTPVVILASWTVGYWIAIAFGIGWALALPLSIAVGVGLVVWLEPWRDIPSRLPAPGENVQIAVALALVIVWPLLYELGFWALGILAVLVVGARLAASLRRSSSLTNDARLVSAIVVLATAGIAAAVSLKLSLALVVLASLVAVFRPSLFDDAVRAVLARLGHNPTTSTDEDDEEAADDDGGAAQDPLWDRAWVNTALLLAFGLIIAVWVAGYGPFWNGDNTYHLNKALHYAANPGRFAPQDYMYGVEGLDHFPYVNFMNSYEALVGVVSRFTGLSPWDLVYRGVVPLVALLAPFAVRYAARGLGVRRAGLAGALGAVVVIIAPTIGAATFASLSIGKGFGTIILAPVLLGASGLFVQRPSAQRVGLLVVATIALLATSPSHALSAGILIAAFTMSAVWSVWRNREDNTRPWRRDALVALVPLGFIGGFALFARIFQGRADPIQEQLGAVFKMPNGETAWTFGNSIELPVHWQTAGLVVGATIILVWFAASREPERRALGLAFATLYVLVLPKIYNFVVIDLLAIGDYSYRLFAVFFFPAVLGLAFASVDRSRLGVLTVVAAVIAIGISGPSVKDTGLKDLRSQSPKIWDGPRNWTSGIDTADSYEQSADQMIAATPTGGRFLAPAAVEEVATARTIDRYPTYARDQFVLSFERDAGTPDEFVARERNLLQRAVNGTARDDVTSTQLADALDAVEVDTVCVGPEADPRLAEALDERFHHIADAPSCALWTREDQP